MTKTLGIVGAGMIGSTLARLAVDAGLSVVLSNSRAPETLSDLVSELGSRARAATPAEAALAGDMVVATIPLVAYDKLPVAALAGKTVIDTMNYYPDRDGHIAELDSDELTSSALVQRHLTDSHVVKACNNIFFRCLLTLARPVGAPDRSALPNRRRRPDRQDRGSATAGHPRLRHGGHRNPGRQLTQRTQHPGLRAAVPPGPAAGGCRPGRGHELVPRGRGSPGPHTPGEGTDRRRRPGPRGRPQPLPRTAGVRWTPGKAALRVPGRTRQQESRPWRRTRPSRPGAAWTCCRHRMLSAPAGGRGTSQQGAGRRLLTYGFPSSRSA